MAVQKPVYNIYTLYYRSFIVCFYSILVGFMSHCVSLSGRHSYGHRLYVYKNLLEK